LIFQSFHKVEDIVKIIDDITQQCKTYKELCVFVPNLHQQHNNRTGKRYIEDLFSQLSSRIAYYWKEQDNRLFLSSYNPVSHISETDESKNHEENNNVLNPILDFQSDDTLKILHILVGCGIDVPPRGYGGTEEVIYHYKRVAESRGHEVELKHIDEITYEDMKYYDVIHNHIGGFHEILEQRNMPYVYTMHDSWAKIHGKGSFGHNINNKVIKNSLFTLVPAKNLVDYFDYSDKTFHLDHGVDTNFYFKYRDKPEEQKRLICVGGNDERKGFHLAILAARELNMPITIIGPDSVHADYNEKFYNIVKECRKHIDVVVTGNVDKTVLRNYINTGHIVIHPAIEETGQPCLGVLEAMACGLPAISTMQDNVDIPGMVQIKRNVEDIIDSVKIILNDYDNFSKKAREFAESRDWNIIFDSLEKHYYRAKELKRKYPLDMKERLIHNYEFSEKTDSKFDTKFNITYKPNPHINITGTSGRKFDVEFIDNKTGYCHYRTTLSENTWAASNISYYVDWKVIVRDNATQDILFVDRHMFIGKKVHIVFDSAALGDNIAWMGVVDAFNKKHNCKVSASTFFNDIFKEQYSDIEFVEPNTYFSNFDYTYKLGFFEKSHLSPNDCKNVSLQQLAAGILGLHEFVETIPKITVKEKETEIKNPYVVIATQSTAQAKYWNNPGSWEKIVDFLKEKNYDVVCVDKHKIYGSGEYMNTSPVNTIPRHERTLDQTIATINEAEFFIGLGSGLSWLAWALNKHVVLISGFSNPMSEFSTNCTRIFNDKGCNSCYNRHKFDPGDWLWCPDQKGTDRMFECTKNITPEEVIQAIENIIEMRNNE
jgi:autotransporter strand-loop-strand O-heptosyltransferase